MKAVTAIIDLQFGSTGKGQVAGTLGRSLHPDTVVSANGPNAGHTYCWEGNKVVFTTIPVSSVLPTVRNILLGPGSVIDSQKLVEEIASAKQFLIGKRVVIHPNAAIVTDKHREAEKSLIGIGSTMKGTAEAVIEKMRRRPDASIAKAYMYTGAGGLAGKAFLWGAGVDGVDLNCSSKEYDRAVESSNSMIVEGAQGASLSIHSDFYPHTTSRDVSIAQLWADCRLPFQRPTTIIGVCRTYPIRVANRFNPALGVMIGYSGPCYPDQEEITWESISRQPELTTVTKLPRRIFTFSTKQIIEAARLNHPDQIVLTFCDYLQSLPTEKPFIIDSAVLWRKKAIEIATGAVVCALGYGPDQDNYFEIDGNHAVPMYPR